MRGAAACARDNPALSGVLSTSSGSSPVTSATRTVTANGTLQFGSIASDGGTPQYELAGGSWTNITEGLTLYVAVSQSFRVRCTLITPTDECTFNVTKYIGGSLIEAVTLTRT